MAAEEAQNRGARRAPNVTGSVVIVQKSEVMATYGRPRVLASGSKTSNTHNGKLRNKRLI